MVTRDQKTSPPTIRVLRERRSPTIPAKGPIRAYTHMNALPMMPNCKSLRFSSFFNRGNTEKIACRSA